MEGSGSRIVNLAHREGTQEMPKFSLGDCKHTKFNDGVCGFCVRVANVCHQFIFFCVCVCKNLSRTIVSETRCVFARHCHKLLTEGGRQWRGVLEYKVKS